MKNKILLLIILILIFIGCKKSPFHENLLPGPWYTIPVEMKAWTMFKPGSYWIYKNEVTGISDSSNYKYGPYYEEDKCINCPQYQKIWYFVTSPFFVKFKLIGGADSNARLELTTRMHIDGSKTLTYNTLMHPDNLIDSSDYCTTYRSLGVFNNFVVNGNVFNNVIGTRVDRRANCFYGDAYYYETYFAKNIGILKFHSHMSTGDTTMTLVKWHTIQ
jgi:hypothetical protein